jgi:uncharacterized surface protein with fasciclin (FAS1) repeats
MMTTTASYSALVSLLLCACFLLSQTHAQRYTWESLLVDDGSAIDDAPAKRNEDVWGSFLEGGASTMSCTDTVFNQLSQDGDFTLLVKALREVGLSDSLDGPSHATIFAPTDSAFANLGKGSQGSAILNMDLVDVIQYHLSDEPVDIGSDQALQDPTGIVTRTISTRSERPLTIDITPFTTNVNRDATVIETEEACNGKIIKVDKVLLPPTASYSNNNDMDMGRAVPLPSENDGAAPCGPGECCDKQPPEFTCKDQAEWGKCEEEWLRLGGYCRESCGFCFKPRGGDSRPPANAFQPPPTEGGEEDGSYQPDSSVSEDPLSDYVREGLLYQQWLDIPGWRISEITNTGRILEQPSTAFQLNRAGDDFSAPANYISTRNSVSRMSGFFCAPLSGDYKFFLTSDDSSRLYIADGPADEKQRLAKISGYKRPDEWVSSRVVDLKKGQSYFLEAMQKQQDGGGHLTVGVQLPSGAFQAPVPIEFFSADCKGESTQLVESLPTPNEEDACSCTDDGYSGSSGNRVDTGRKGCFTYDFRDQMVDGAGNLGERFGSGIGQYFTNRWGAAPDTVNRLANYWGGVATRAASESRDTSARICYVKYPEHCSTSLPSREVQGAQWRRC